MGITREQAPTPGHMSVTFAVPPERSAATAQLVAEFNGWSPTPMQPRPDGGHELTVELAAGATYRFRYLIDDELWENDWAADGYIGNDYGSEDSVVVLEAIAKAGPSVAPRPKKRPARASKARATAGD